MQESTTVINIMGFFPLWLIFIVTVVSIFAALTTGFIFGKRSAGHKDAKDSTPPIGSVVAAMLGLLAFLLALTFSTSSSRFEMRQKLLIDDINAIGSTYDRADALTESDRVQVKQLLREYTDVYLAIDDNPQELTELLAVSRQIQVQLWAIASSYPKGNVSAVLAARFSDSVDLMKNVHTKRLIYATHIRIQPTIWLSLFGVGLLSLAALGFQFGISGGTRYKVSFLLALCFSAILILIMDLERPAEGTIRIDSIPMQYLRAQME